MQLDKNGLGEEPIGKLLFKMSVPAVIGMFVNALYNIVDTIYIARGVGTEAIGGLSVAFPIQIFIMAFGMLFGTGAASLISRSLGAKDRQTATRAAGNALLISLITGVAMMIPSLILINPLLKLFGATDALLPYAREYLQVIMVGAPFLIFLMSGNNIARAEGKAKTAMFSILIGTVLNIILDPIFIFVFNMGIRGAAIATVLSHFFQFVFLIIFFIRRTGVIHIDRDSLVLRRGIIIPICSLGVASFIRNASTTLVSVLLNNMLRRFGGDIAISTFGVMYRVMLFGLMPLFGMTQGFQPIAGYNFGAKKYDRLWSVLKQSIVVSTVWCLLFALSIYIFPEKLLIIFSSDRELIALGSEALRYVMLLTPLIGIQMIGSTFFLAVGKVIPSFVLGLSRQVILLLPLVAVLPQFFGLNGIWVAFPIADFAAVIITVIWLIIEIRRLNRSLRNELNAE